MALKDVKLYYLQQQDIYFQLLEDVKRCDEDVKNGLIKEEDLTPLYKELDKIKTNYERLSYIMFLFNEPKDKKHKEQFKKQSKVWYDYLSSSSKEAILDESRDALKTFKQMVLDLKEKNKHD